MLHAPETHDFPDVAAAPAGYVRDPELNLLHRPDFSGIGYSDGAEAERHIHAAVCGARDRGTFSDELAHAIVDWPSEYHLSRERHCLVRPLGIQPGDTVLELGCGCGAITRYLGEIRAQVTAVEGAFARARIAAERCRDLPNVTVVAEDFLRLEIVERFDWVLLVGVLEYAAVFSDTADPVTQVLSTAAGYLAPRGRLVVAIENKLGLKYFNGCTEDHLGIPFLGIQGLYGARTPRTFGRSELAAHLHDAGLPHAQFHYPFPDYKLPRVVLGERAMSDPDFDAAGMLGFLQARDYGGNPCRLFDEGLAAREAARNGLLADLSNSFLVVAGRERLAAGDVLAIAFAVQRNAEFAAQTTFMREGDAVRVRKERLFPQREGRQRLADGSTLQHVAEDRLYVPGALALTALTVARASRGDLAAIVAALEPWFGFLLSQASRTGPRLADVTLPGGFLDVTPFNLVETAQGLVPIDMEWRIEGDIPLGWVTARSVVHSLWGIAGFERTAVTVAQVVEALCVHHALVVSRDEIAGWLAQESELRMITSGEALPQGDLASRQLAPPAYLTGQEAKIAELTRTAADLEARIDGIYRSRSWRYSYPIRAAGALLRRGPAQEVAARSADAPAAAEHRPQAGLPYRDDIKRYGIAFAVVVVTFALSRLLIAAGVHVPRLLLYIAAVAIAARAGGFGPGVFATLASVAAIMLVSFHELIHNAAFAQSFGTFLVCALIGILVSVRPTPLRRSRFPRADTFS